MRAAVRTRYGPPEVLSIQDVPKPTPARGELLVRVHAATVNRTDCGILWGEPFIIRFFTGLRRPKLPSTGTDFAGTVEAVGEAVSRFQVGDRVWGFDDNGCGSHAEYIAFPESKGVMPIPEGLSFADAAACAEGAHYAYNFITKVPLKAGDKVLVNGASGAIGSAMVQLLKGYGAHVVAVCHAVDSERVKALGPDRIIALDREDFTQDAERYPYVFDAVGKSTFGACRLLLQPKGVYISSELGPGAQNPFLALLTPLLGGRRVAFPVPLDIPRSLRHIQGLLEQGRFRPLMDRSYPLEQIREAFAHVRSGQKVGNVVLELAPTLSH